MRRFAVPALAVVLMAAGLPIGASLAAADEKAPTLQQVNDVKGKLKQLSAEVGKTKGLVEDAEKKLPGLEQNVQKASEVVGRANDQVIAAQAEVDKAVAAVKAQQVEIEKVKAEVERLLIEVSKLARRSYIDGGQYQSLELIMGASEPSDLANQRVAVKRTSRENSKAYDQLMAAKAALAAKLAELKQLQEQTKQREAEAEAKAGAARAAQSRAEGAQQAVQDLLAQRNKALETVQVQLREIRETYKTMVAQYEAANGGSTKVPGAKRQPARSGQAVIDWALQWVGKGSMYDGLCLAFVDDAYGASSGRVGTAIGQWYRAKDAGHGHPGDRTPPVGAQVFWWSGNPARHIALYAGGGMVITTGGDGDRVAILSMEDMDAWGPYIGWAPGYYG